MTELNLRMRKIEKNWLKKHQKLTAPNFYRKEYRFSSSNCYAICHCKDAKFLKINFNQQMVGEWRTCANGNLLAQIQKIPVCYIPTLHKYGTVYKHHTLAMSIFSNRTTKSTIYYSNCFHKFGLECRLIFKHKKHSSNNRKYTPS